MNCKNCGAQFDEKTGICPYCGGEDKAAAGEKHKKRIKQIISKRKEIQNIPNAIPRRVSKGLWKVLAVVAIIFVIAVVIIGISSAGREKDQYEKEQAEKNQLETLLVQKKYDELTEYLDGLESTYYYGKYTEVGTLYSDYISMKNSIENYRDDVDKGVMESRFLVEQACDIIKKIARIIHRYDTLTGDDKRLGNDEYLKDIRDTAYNYAMNEMNFSQDIIERAVKAAAEYEKDYTGEKSAYYSLAEEFVGEK